MNLQDLIETLYQLTGTPDTANARPDGTFQRYKDLINSTQSKLCAYMHPSMDFLIRDVTLTVVAGTPDYFIDDWCQHPLSLIESTYGNRISLRRRLNADTDGSRNPNLTGSTTLEQAVNLSRTTSAVLSNIAGSTTGISATEGALTADIGSGNDVLTNAVVGKMLKFNGESGDYKILSVATRTITVDRPIISRVSGIGTTHAGAGYAKASCRWEIGPKGRYKLRFLPSIGNSPTVRYMAYPRKLLSLTDEPELQEDMHDLLWMGPMMDIGASKENANQFSMWKERWEETLKLLAKSDNDDCASDDGPRVERLCDWVPTGVSRGTDLGRMGY